VGVAAAISQTEMAEEQAERLGKRENGNEERENELQQEDK